LSFFCGIFQACSDSSPQFSRWSLDKRALRGRLASLKSTPKSGDLQGYYSIEHTFLAGAPDNRLSVLARNASNLIQIQ
jgi:hypothetical protein